MARVLLGNILTFGFFNFNHYLYSNQYLHNNYHKQRRRRAYIPRRIFNNRKIGGRSKSVCNDNYDCRRCQFCDTDQLPNKLNGLRAGWLQIQGFSKNRRSITVFYRCLRFDFDLCLLSLICKKNTIKSHHRSPMIVDAFKKNFVSTFSRTVLLILRKYTATI